MTTYGNILGKLFATLVCIGLCSGQGTFNTSNPAAYTVNCGSTLNVTVDTTDSFWQSLGGADADYYINNVELTGNQFNGSSFDACKGTYNSGANQVTFSVALEGCNVAVASTPDNIQYNYTLWRDHKSKFANHTGIARYHLKQVSITCNFNRTLENTTTSPIAPNIRIGHYILNAIAATYEFHLSFADSSYVATNAPSTVLVDDYIYARAWIPNAEARIKVQFVDCWAHSTPTAAKGDAGSYTLIENGCPKNTTTDANSTIVIEQNNNQNYANFKFRSFVWNDQQIVSNRNTNIYLSCVMKACRDACTSTCGHTINYKLARRRRSADEETVAIDKNTLMTGPVQVIKPVQ